MVRELPIDGDYSVRVYLVRSAARRNETANYTLSVSIIGSADAKVAQTPYNAVGTVPCSVGTDPKGSAQCSFCVIRSAPGQADVHLASPGYDFLRNVSSASPVPAAATPQSLSKSPVAVPVQSSSAWESPSAPTPAKQTAKPNFAQPKKTIYT